MMETTPTAPPAWKALALQYLPIVLRLVLGAMFLQSGVAKILSPDAFLKAAQDYHVLSPTLTQAYALMLPWLEALAGAYVLIGLFTRFSAGLMALLTLSFIIAISIVLAKGDSVSCGCFLGGDHSDPVTPLLLWRDIAIFVAAAYLAWFPRSIWRVDNVLTETVAAPARSKPAQSKRAKKS